jgi:hypothetical protein
MIEPSLMARPSQSVGCRILQHRAFDATWETVVLNTKIEVHFSEYLRGRFKQFLGLQVF